METQGRKCAPAWSTQEVMDLMAVWGEDSVQAELRSSRRNADIYAKIVRGTGEKGYTRDTQQCHVKIKELWQAYQKRREANSHSGSAPQTLCCLYEELHTILSGDPTTTPKCSVDTSQEPWATSSNNEEDIVDEEEEEEEEKNVRQASGGSILPDSRKLFLTLEPIPSQDQLVVEHDAGENISGKPYQIPPQWALVASRVADNFMDDHIAHTLGIPVQSKTVPDLEETVGGSFLSLGQVT
ncbi:Zinc finger and SCAN domain-containing protein 29 [Chelonia mydas]|uniref:Zinc finger and SCAN domain-containing protein 29 n=1 Tax=Chelonia mydas TaxID=8469 RepID=M7BGT5_CHEMY|nr:Zinc finger and SCAN domain-containing protein 29 [Chelonia mydas]